MKRVKVMLDGERRNVEIYDAPVTKEVIRLSFINVRRIRYDRARRLWHVTTCKS